MSYLRQEWPVEGGTLILVLSTDGPATRSQIESCGAVVAAIEAHMVAQHSGRADA